MTGDAHFVDTGPRGRMSELGPSRWFDPLPVTSGLPRTTDINRPAPLVRSMPFATEMVCPCRVRFQPDSGLTDETRARPVEAYRRFAAVFHALITVWLQRLCHLPFRPIHPHLPIQCSHDPDAIVGPLFSAIRISASIALKKEFKKHRTGGAVVSSLTTTETMMKFTTIALAIAFTVPSTLALARGGGGMH